MANRPPPVVLAIGGHDPTGGAGLVADAQTLSSLGCHPVTAITALTVQDLVSAHQFQMVDSDLLRRQCQVLFNGFPVRAVKIGMLGSAEVVTALAPLLAEAALPLVVDPVLTSGDGSLLAEPRLNAVIHSEIVPLATIVTPNCAEARTLTGTTDIDSAARDLLSAGGNAVLVTGTDDANGPDVIHKLYLTNAAPQIFSFPRLPGSFHGSGCTLASAISAYLARGVELTRAVDNALRYTYDTLRDAIHFSEGQAVPKRWGRHDN